VEGRKSPSPIDLAHGLYNSLYYRTSRDRRVRNTYSLNYAHASRIHFCVKLWEYSSQKCL